MQTASPDPEREEGGRTGICLTITDETESRVPKPERAGERSQPGVSEWGPYAGNEILIQVRTSKCGTSVGT